MAADGTGYVQRVQQAQIGSNASLDLATTCLRVDLRTAGSTSPQPLPPPPGGWPEVLGVPASGSHCVGLLADGAVVGDGDSPAGYLPYSGWISRGATTAWVPPAWDGHPVKLVGTAGTRILGTVEYTTSLDGGARADRHRLVTSTGGAWRVLRQPKGYGSADSYGTLPPPSLPGPDAPHVIGTVQRTLDSPTQAVLWRDGGPAPEVLPRPRGGSALPRAVNADGVVVGLARRAGSNSDRAVMWRDGDRIDLSAALPDGSDSGATLVSGAGVAAGYVVIDGQDRLVIWSVRRA